MSNNQNPNFDKQATSLKIKNVHGEAFVSFTYKDNKPCMLSFSAWKKDTDEETGKEIGEARYHHITLSYEDILNLKKMMDENLKHI